MTCKIDKKRLAIVLLAYADFEAMEIALAAFSKTLKNDMKLFILQNGRNSYDCERTYRVGLRYQKLFPEHIKVVDWITPQAPYHSIKQLLIDEALKDFDYICKVDDDVFPLREDWLDKLVTCYEKSKEKHGDSLGYVTSLVNNNPWGFKETLKIFELEKEYLDNISMAHEVGAPCDDYEPIRLVSKNEICDGWGGTVWRNPYISRWLHKKTSFDPKKFIHRTENLGYKEIPNNKRYSINCMLFEKTFWTKIDSGDHDDELMVRNYCMDNDKKIMADLSNPFVHICFYTQREENRDLLPKFREVYEEFLKLPYPISMCPNKEYENENRLRYIETQFLNKNSQDLHKIFNILGVKIKIRKK